MKLHRRRDPPRHSPALDSIERLADEIEDTAQQIREAVADLRRDDTRGDGHDPAH